MIGTVAATARMYLECAREAAAELRANWLLIPASLAAVVAFIALTPILGRLGLAGGFALGILQLILLSMYYSWVLATVSKERLSRADLVTVDWSLFSNIIGVGFIIWLGSWIISTMVAGIADMRWLPAVYSLAVYLVFNCAPEMILVRRIDGMPALRESAEFIKRNWIEWFLPLVLLLTPWIRSTPESLLVVISGSEVFLPASLVFRATAMALTGLPMAVVVVVGVLLGNWFTIFRVHLFRELESGNRRMRVFRSRLH